MIEYRRCVKKKKTRERKKKKKGFAECLNIEHRKLQFWCQPRIMN